jgi:mono/diheme cytochrome c family protein
MKALVSFFVLMAALVGSSTARGQDVAAIERGKYIYTAAGCQGCHTDAKNKGAPLAGGRALVTPFGTYFGPNITADSQHGIGTWSDADFIRALREGISPSGEHYFPVFPYPSFAKMTDRDMLDLKAFIFSLPAVAKADVPHDIKFPFGFRFSMIFWKLLFLDKGPFATDPARDATWNRGAYIVEALAHCGECHTERNFMGAVKKDVALGGARLGPDGDSVPNITPDPDTGIGKWSDEEIIEVLSSGLLPDGDVVAGAMAEVVEGTGKLIPADLAAIAKYLKSLPPVRTASPSAKSN